ncbi:UNVERIFIED_CONTAM: hypothetical protein RMT77_016076 [Armadillidium vulgare]
MSGTKIDVSVDRLKSIPILYTSGTYYEVGFNVGRTFRGLIEDFLNTFKVLHEELIPSYNTEEGKKAYDITLESVEINFPHYVRELQGTADGAKVPFYQLMLLHMDTIVPKNSGKKTSTHSYGCSSICSNFEHQVTLGHTEDALPGTLNHMYILSAHIKEDTPQGKWKTKEERFTAFCYAGHLPGFCMGYNHHGFVYSVNVIFPKNVLAGKTPRHFLTRALLSAESMVEAQNILRDRGVGSADAFSVNMIFTKQEGDPVFHNAEVGPAEDCLESPLSVLTISPGEFLVHTNTFLRLKIPEDFEIEGESSCHRLKCAAKNRPIESRESVLSILSSTEDRQYPFFRDGNTKEDKIKTIAIGLFDILERKWTLWVNNPKHFEPVLSLPLLFKWH